VSTNPDDLVRGTLPDGTWVLVSKRTPRMVRDYYAEFVTARMFVSFIRWMHR
jgi:hypothetical protein